MFSLDPSDVTLIIDLALALVLAVYFAVGRPRTWYRDRLGWVIFGYAVATVALLGLIVYGITFGQKVVEPVRFVVGTALGVALASKTWSVYRERREGRLAGSGPATAERNLMSTPVPQPSGNEAVKVATDIWYKAQRVLRTLIQVIIPAFLGFAVVLPMIIEALGLPVDSELRLWLVAVAAGVSAVAAAIARVMAIPAVNAWLIKVGLGSVPKSAVLDGGVAGVAIAADPKVSTRG